MYVCGLDPVELGEHFVVLTSHVMLEFKSTREYKQGGSPLHLYSLTQVVLQKREELVHQKEVRSSCLGFYTTLVEIYTEEVLRGFIPYGFPTENLCVLLFLCFCACCSFGDLLVIICFKISSKQIDKT